MICSFCAKEFTRANRASTTRAAQPGPYCSRACRGRDQSARSRAAFADKFWLRLKPATENGCREWGGNRRLRGYGIVDLEGRPQLAHRVAYHISTGQHPGELSVCHTCDNPPCCEPSHLWLGTHKQNMLDMADKGRTNPPSFLGERHPGAKLAAIDVVRIRTSPESSNALAAHYGVTAENIRRIRKRKTWRHV